MKAKFIVFEGLSGVGKTTIANIFSKISSDYVYYKTPPDLFRLLREDVDLSYSTPARFFFYLAGIVQSSDEINQLLKEGKTVFCDRYIHSTICWHKAIGFDGTKYVPKILLPDLSILLSCEKETRHNRLFSRKEFTINDEKELEGNLEFLFEENLKKQKMVEVDNSGLLDVTVKNIYEKINSL